MGRNKKKRRGGRSIFFIVLIIGILIGLLLMKFNGFYWVKNKIHKVQGGRLITIDAGHGGNQPGSLAGDVVEKELNLQIALKLQVELQNRGYQVIMTRTGDETVDLLERTEIANNTGADLFISIHQNAFEDGSVHGIETWYHDGKAATGSEKLATLIQSSLVRTLKAADRGIRSGDKLVVVRETIMPACLVEAGYITNENERSLLKSDEYQNKIATAIADGIDSYFQQ